MASEQGTGTALKRRGILAAAGAVVAGIVAKQAAQPVRATPGGGDQGFLALGSNPWYIAGSPATNTPAVSSAPTVIQASPNYGNFLGTNGARPTVFMVDARPASGTFDISAIEGIGRGGGHGVYGESGIGYGVVGYSPSNYGVSGQSGSSAGVSGSSGSGTGVYGLSFSAYGVYGYSSKGIGVYGESNSAGTTFITAGVYGASFNSYGVIGSTAAPGYSGLTAITGTAGVAALAATSTNASAYAAYFSGTTVVQGNFVAFGGSKSAAVKDATGQHRLVYCVESPESWFEDFGEAKLVGGKADVKLDPVFAQIAHTDDYHVFLTEHSDHHLHVASRTAGGFTVEADVALAALKGKKAADLSGTFSYRVVAKRADVRGERLAKFEPPRINHPDPDKLPKPEPIPPPPPPRKP